MTPLAEQPREVAAPPPEVAPAVADRPAPETEVIAPPERIEPAISGPAITVDVYAEPGIATDRIRDLVATVVNGGASYDIWIVQGGKNNFWNLGGSAIALYGQHLSQIRAMGNEHGAYVIHQEVTPIDVDILNSRGLNAAAYRSAIEGMNAWLNRMNVDEGWPIVWIYESFRQNYHGGGDAWCRNRANMGEADGSHLSPAGAEALGMAWWEAIRPWVMRRHEGQPIRVAVFGDSISACTYLPEEQKPGAWLLHFSGQRGPLDRSEYK